MLSVVTSRFLAVLITVRVTATPATVTSSSCVSDPCFALVSVTIASDLSRFRNQNKNPMPSKQRCIDWKRSLITLRVLSMLRAMYNRVASEYWAW